MNLQISHLFSCLLVFEKNFIVSLFWPLSLRSLSLNFLSLMSAVPQPNTYTMYPFFTSQRRSGRTSPSPSETSLFSSEWFVFPPDCSLAYFIFKLPLRQWSHCTASLYNQLMLSYHYIWGKRWYLSLLCVSITYHKSWHKQKSFPWMLNEWNVLFGLHHSLPKLLFQGRFGEVLDAQGTFTLLVLLLKSDNTSCP